MSGKDATVAFYDGLAEDYHLVYGDRWEEAVERQGAALARLIAAEAPAARDVLDCACGIGTQAIGLAHHGYRVAASDVSERALARARREAARLSADITFAQADFRDLSGLGRRFDVVVSADNAVPHMPDDEEIERALRGMHDALRDGGLLVISTRDYDAVLRDRAPTPPPIQIAGPPRRLVLRLHDSDAGDARMHTVRFLVLTESAGGWTVDEHRVPYRAVTADELSAAAQRAGLRAVTWHAADAIGFHQPVMTARRPAVGR